MGFIKKATSGDEAYNRSVATKTSPADVVMWSGSKDDQTSYVYGCDFFQSRVFLVLRRIGVYGTAGFRFSVVGIGEVANYTHEQGSGVYAQKFDKSMSKALEVYIYQLDSGSDQSASHHHSPYCTQS